MDHGFQSNAPCEWTGILKLLLYFYGQATCMALWMHVIPFLTVLRIRDEHTI